MLGSMIVIKMTEIALKRVKVSERVSKLFNLIQKGRITMKWQFKVSKSSYSTKIYPKTAHVTEYETNRQTIT